MAKSLLIKDTTVSERAQIVREALGADGDCEGIGLSDMYAMTTATPSRRCSEGCRRRPLRHVR